MSNFIKIANRKDIPEETGMAIDIEGKSIALFNISGNFYAIDNICKHRGGPLGEGSLEGKEVMCPWHGWQYDVTTGECLSSPSICQKKFDVKIEGDDILVDASND
ncbi:MAG: nitrite reductase small subunit NirD [Chlamydiae bacterium]|nr:nitrite reductase small subunit NirD [Chlamydiota bacterium]MBI3277210.1 nitrite reductase small subunit NirD [Chlamydiota bacterium]